MRPLPIAAGLAEGRRPGASLLYDWGRPVEGYLSLEIPPAKELGMALLFVGDGGPRAICRPIRSPAVPPPPSSSCRASATGWTPCRAASATRCWSGLKRPAVAAVLPVPAPAAAAEPIKRRVFGIQGPPLRTPVEDEVWSKLQRLAGVAGRKEL